ncbi:Alpha/Beta hydrolase protein [Aspergillus granulosus]|uniref:Alpha/Beta hydrolase protein n=1 Tax=Aspergillus granulosus TaxID=176169 RepID=A0ABR4GWN9_9EURO
MPLALHPEVAANYGPALEALAAAPKLAPHEVESVRANLDMMINSIATAIPVNPNIQTTTYEALSFDGYIVKITRLAVTKTRLATPGPAVLYIHGGGYIHGDAMTWTRFIQNYIHETGIPFYSVEYRLAPEHPFPAAIEDLYAALKWLHGHAEELGVDTARIATFGQSAGGGLAAALGIMMRDHGILPPLAKQILIYPALDDRNTTPRPALDHLTFWPTEWNSIAWTAYLGADKVGGSADDVSPHAAPARVANFAGLPKTYMDIGGLDIFRDECIAFAAGIAGADIDIEMHIYPGLPHGFDVGIEPSGPAKKAAENRIAALRSI